jgi:hypothetical protein
VIHCETRDSSRDYITEILLQHGYTMFNWDTRPRERVDRACFNTLAIPPQG